MPRSLKTLLLSWLALVLAVGVGLAGPVEDRLARVYGGIDASTLKTGVLYDRVLPLSGMDRFDGRAGAAVASSRLWLQMYDELRRASLAPSVRPSAETLVARARSRHDAIPIALLFDRYERVRGDAVERGMVEVREGRLQVRGEPFEVRTAFAAAALREQTWRGGEISFVLDRAAHFSNVGVPLTHLEMDLDDGLGFRSARFDAPITAHYASTGTKTVRLRARAGGETLEASAAVIVRALAAPLPNDTLHVTGTIPYLGGVAAGDAYVYLAPAHSTLENPAVVVEGFDLDNTMNWDELYALLNQENLVETLRADGYDVVVLNFADATDYMQRNGLLVVELLQQLRATIPSGNTLALAGASMGGLVSRYALGYMESNSIPHSVRTYLSFDSPHLGANIPLGIQYWVKFFSGQSTDAAFLLSRLDRPAARQMLVYHYTDPPGATGQADPLRATWMSEVASVGWPSLCRTVAIANGSNTGAGQGFAAGAQIIQWSHSDFFVTILGNVWAVPNVASTKIFDGRIRIIFIQDVRQAVTVSGTAPYDGAPGGSRTTMTDMDQTAAPYGDIVALHPGHCFIPTGSALAYDHPDLFHPIAGDPDPLTHTPFDAIYAPAANQEHVTITPENAVWIRNEIEAGVTGVGSLPTTAAVSLGRPIPNPSLGLVRIGYTLPRSATVDVRVLGVDGREVARVASGPRGAGTHSVDWSGLDAQGVPVAAGVYFVRLAVEGKVDTRRIVRLR